jgi:hypothetical protein
MRLMILLLIVAGACLWWGTQNTLVALKERHQLEMTCADYLTKRPDARWLKLTHCEYDFDHLAYEQYKSGNISKVYLPLRPEGEAEGQPTRIVVVRDDKEMVDLTNALEKDEAVVQGDQERVMESLKKPAEGLVQFGLDLDDKDKKDLANLGLGLDKDFVLIDYGAKPKLTKGLVAMLVGLGSLGLFVFLLMRRFRKPKAPPAPPRPMNPNNPISAFERPL